MSNLKRRAAALLASLLVVGIGVFALQTPASAGTTEADCWSGYICIYENVGWTGSEYDIYAPYNRNTCVTFGWGFWWDRASSIANRAGTSVNFYNDAYCGGASLWMWNGMSISNLGNWGANDSLDSVWIN